MSVSWSMGWFSSGRSAAERWVAYRRVRRLETVEPPRAYPTNASQPDLAVRWRLGLRLRSKKLSGQRTICRLPSPPFARSNDIEYRYAEPCGVHVVPSCPGGARLFTATGEPN